MFNRLIKFLNLSEDQQKQLDELRQSFEKEDEQINAQLKDLMKQKKESMSTKKAEFENILTDEQKDKMSSLFDLFSPFGASKMSCEGSN